MFRCGVIVSVAGGVIVAAPGLASSPFAAQVVSFTQGTGASPALGNAASALGEPSRFTADPQFPGAVTPFAPAYRPEQIVSIGQGGQLTVRFDQPVTNDPVNPFGIDLLVFGTSFFFDPTFAPVATGLFGGRGQVEVSPDGVNWTLVAGTRPDGLFPTLGYVDTSDPFGGPAGNVLTDFTRPVDPAFAWQGLGLAQLVAGYQGSGGGAGIDLTPLGLSAISFVRVSVAPGESGVVNIDGFSDVAIPAPGAGVVLAVALSLGARRRRA